MQNHSEQLRIAIFTDSFLPMISGVVTVTLNLAHYLAERGHYVLIVTPGAYDHEIHHPNIEIEAIASIPAHFYENFKWSAPFSPRIREIVKERRIQAVHFMTPFTVSFVGINIARSLNLPVIGTFHTFISDPSNYRHVIREKFFDVKEESVWHYSNLYYNAADINTAPAASTKQEMREHGSNVDIEVISNGIDPALFDNSRAESFRKQYGLNGKTILYFGRVSQDKNMQVLLDVFFTVVEQVPDARMLIIGSGPQLNSLKMQAKAHPEGDRILFTGGIPHNQLVISGVFKACEVFATTSVTENQPMTMLEAQVNGMPCVGFDRRGVSSLIEDDVNGRLLPDGDIDGMAAALIEILTDTRLQERYRAGAEQLVQKHFLPNVIDRWEVFYREVINNYKAGLYPEKKRLHIHQILALLTEIKINLPYKGRFFSRS